jgi:putative ABC transport system permease protein
MPSNISGMLLGSPGVRVGTLGGSTRGAGTHDGGVPARRAAIRWAWRLCRREWRQQSLVLAMLTVAVAAMVLGEGAATNTPPPDPSAAAFGTASALVTLPGSDPHLAADIAAVEHRYGPGDVIESRPLAAGPVPGAQLRAQDPAGRYGGPMLALVAGHYPRGPGQVAMTSQIASYYRVHAGGTWAEGGRRWHVTGVVENPADLQEEFALVAPGQVTAPAQVSILLGAKAVPGPDPWGRSPPGLPGGAAVQYPSRLAPGKFSPVDVVLAVTVLGLVFIGLVAVAGFTVLAQRRRRAVGMLSALGATDRNIRLVMVANGAIVGGMAALLGAVAGLAAWFGYVPRLEAAAGHVIDPLNLPWWAIATGMVLAVATAMITAWWPARAVARTPVAEALSQRPAPPKTVRRSAWPGVALFAAGVLCLAFAGGKGGEGEAGGGVPLLLIGLVAVVAGFCLLAPLWVTVLAAAIGRREPVAVRIAVRDLVRYRSRSGAALAAVSFAVFLAVLVCIIASVRFSNDLNWVGPNLGSDQLIVYTPYGSEGQGSAPPDRPTAGQLTALHAKVDGLAAALHARSVLALDMAAPADPGLVARLQQPGGRNLPGPLYVATPALLAQYHITRAEPDADVLTMRPGLAAQPGMRLDWGPYYGPFAGLSSGCPPSSCLAGPVIQNVPGLPSGTSAPNTVLTMHAVGRLGLRLIPYGWLVQAARPLTAAQISAARQLTLTAGLPLVTVETKSGQLGLGQVSAAATAAGILIALAVLIMTAGLLRSETGRDLSTLTATGASGWTRRALTGATAGALGLLGAVLGTAAAVIAGVAWAHSSPLTMFGNVPPADMVLILAGLPAAAALGGWLLGGREPPAIARQPLD